MTRQYDGVRPVVEGTLDGDTWSTTAVNYWEGSTYYSPLASRYLPNGGGAYNYLADGLGSTRQLMSNATHAITDTYTYDAFGNTLASTGSTDNPYRYIGALGYRAGGGGMMQLGARWYVAGVGRFLSLDPITSGLQRAMTGQLRATAVSVYAENSPNRLTDPSGWAPTSLECLQNYIECLRAASIEGSLCKASCLHDFGFSGALPGTVACGAAQAGGGPYLWALCLGIGIGSGIAFYWCWRSCNAMETVLTDSCHTGYNNCMRCARE